MYNKENCLVDLGGTLHFITPTLIPFKLKYFTDATNVIYVGVDKIRKQAFVQMRNNSRYLYEGVSIDVIDKLDGFKEDSWRYWHELLKGKFRFIEIENMYVSKADNSEVISLFSSLQHDRVTSVGLWAMDKDPRDLLFDFWQRTSDACPLEVSAAEKQEKEFNDFVDKVSFQIK